MTFFSKNLYYIKKKSEMYYHVFSTKKDQEGVSIHKKKNLFPEKLPLISISIRKYIGTTFKKNLCIGQVLLCQKLPGESEMAFTTAISSFSILFGGKRHITNPSEKVSKRSRPNKWMETGLHIFFLSFWQ